MVYRPVNSFTAQPAASSFTEWVLPDRWPHVSEGLVRFLQARYPDRCRRITESEREHDRYAGAVSLINELALVLAYQTSPGSLDDPEEEEEEEDPSHAFRASDHPTT